ncbi:MAG: hypothetical protein P8L30_04870 [Longimicrobiales bacterium]|nr:hypothetical protein [Longimicrobiales bacterium]
MDAVSSWTLAKAVAKKGQLGVVSSTSLDATLVRHPCAGDQGGTSAEGRRGAMIVYEKGRRRYFSLRRPPRRCPGAGAIPVRGPQGTELPVVTWGRDGVEQALVGALRADQLLLLAEAG